MTGARAWLEARRPAPPASLRTAIHSALEPNGHGRGRGAEDAGPDPVAGERGASAPASIAVELAGAALRALRAVARGAGGRASATQLLAADALLTYACEAAAEEGPAALGALTSFLGPARFEALLAEARP